MGVKITVDGNGVHIHLSVLQKVIAVQGDIRIPLGNIKLPVRERCIQVGADIPGVFTAANYYHLDGTHDFYYFADASRTIGLDIINDPRRKVVIVQVEDGTSVEEVVNAISNAVQSSDDHKTN
ncbi:hypothetical protein PBRA_007023 [Plasmodiophora brassicae]|uniref:Uncharacterized protein n=1 Tax=Plasmodiophora brassicae TaxID=37360 RepID=A0A0G4IUU6_PLABS|nr:hypothetical protein PBRA_007023 [Plasmodiophora brassicae]